MKLTRKSYNRRVFTFGALVFLAIALMSTGFATWVMSTNAETGESGNVHVGTITDGALSFVETDGKKVVFDATTGSDFVFDSDKNDTEGSIKAGKGDGAQYENLSVKFTVQIQPAEFLDYLEVKVTDLPQGILDAAEENYIVLPDAAKEKPQEAVVIAVGPGKCENGKCQPMQVKEGDHVIFSKYAGTEVKLEDEEYIIASESDIIAIVE